MMSNTHQTPPLKAVMSLREELSLDERRYLEACEAGLLYETIQEEAGDASLDRNVLKQVIFRDVFFGRNGSNAPFKKTFQRLYPNVMSVVRELKAKDYRNLARLMQKYESSLMIGAICGRIMKERSDMPLVTIHDSVATTEEHYQYLKTIVLEEFRKIGIQPSLKTERWQ